MIKIVSVSVTLAVLASPLIASADAIRDLQIRINDLIVQVALLKGNLKIPEGVTSYGGIAQGCVSLTRNLTPGDTDAATDGRVSALQRFLADEPGIYPEALVTGYFGPATKRAVQNWQRSHGIISSGDTSSGYGSIGPRTRVAMAAGCGAPAEEISSEKNAPPICTISVNTAKGIGLVKGDGGTSVASGPGDPVSITWSSVNATRATLTGQEAPVYGMALYNPTTDTKYSWTFAGPRGEATCAVTVVMVE